MHTLSLVRCHVVAATGANESGMPHREISTQPAGALCGGFSLNRRSRGNSAPRISIPQKTRAFRPAPINSAVRHRSAEIGGLGGRQARQVQMLPGSCMRPHTLLHSPGPSCPRCTSQPGSIRSAPVALPCRSPEPRKSMRFRGHWGMWSEETAWTF
jgi:hypothetical protein